MANDDGSGDNDDDDDDDDDDGRTNGDRENASEQQANSMKGMVAVKKLESRLVKCEAAAAAAGCSRWCGRMIASGMIDGSSWAIIPYRERDD